MSRIWLGNYFGDLEDVIAAADIGDGTLYPINWDKTNLSTADDQITKFEVGTGEVTWTFAADVTLRFKNPGAGSDADATATLSFTLVTTSPATTMADLFPSDWTLGGQTFSAGSFITLFFTLPWGTENVDFLYRQIVTLLYLVTGTTDTYTKKCEVAIYGGNSLGSIMLSTNQNSDLVVVGYQPLSTNMGTMTMFHETPTIYAGTDNPSGAFIISDNTLSVTASLPPPLA